MRGSFRGRFEHPACRSAAMICSSVNLLLRMASSFAHARPEDSIILRISFRGAGHSSALASSRAITSRRGDSGTHTQARRAGA